MPLGFQLPFRDSTSEEAEISEGPSLLSTPFSGFEEVTGQRGIHAIVTFNSLFGIQPICLGSLGRIRPAFNSLFGILDLLRSGAVLSFELSTPFSGFEVLSMRCEDVVRIAFNSLFGIRKLIDILSSKRYMTFNSLFGILYDVRGKGRGCNRPFNSLFGIHNGDDIWLCIYW